MRVNPGIGVLFFIYHHGTGRGAGTVEGGNHGTGLCGIGRGGGGAGM